MNTTPWSNSSVIGSAVVVLVAAAVIVVTFLARGSIPTFLVVVLELLGLLLVGAGLAYLVKGLNSRGS